jgi:hypothetical protein
MQKTVKNDVLKPAIEDQLNLIDSGKRKITRYKNAEEYLKHADKILDK